MSAPGVDWINQGIAEAIAALKACPEFMSPAAVGAPPGASGSILTVEAGMPATAGLPDAALPHCGVAYLSHAPSDQDSAGQTDYRIELDLRLYHRGADRAAVWQAVQQAAAAVSRVVSREMGPGGGRFGGFAILARDRGGPGIDVQEAVGFGAVLHVVLTLDITRPDE